MSQILTLMVLYLTNATIFHIIFNNTNYIFALWCEFVSGLTNISRVESWNPGTIIIWGENQTKALKWVCSSVNFYLKHRFRPWNINGSRKLITMTQFPPKRPNFHQHSPHPFNFKTHTNSPAIIVCLSRHFENYVKKFKYINT